MKKHRQFVIGITLVSKEGGGSDLKISTKGDGIPISEAIFYIENWIIWVKEQERKKFSTDFVITERE